MYHDIPGHQVPPPPPAPAPKEKIVPPSPPIRIRDVAGGCVYTRVGFLGEGGFARVYEVQDQKGNRRAVKVVSKASIRTKKNKTKLWAEIKLHQMLDHPHIVKFEDCFEDEENVYMVLELCDNGSLMDLLRRRKRYTEPEARYILVQLIAACQYMHQTNVIHRDLKLGNLFLDDKMDVKVGDFGLAALIEKPGDRKKTICGTPNYIAPEVLFDQANGHSFEVDVWSIGVILYTLLVGKPPFQTKDVKAIYKRIKENRYEFPPDREISQSARDLIMAILNPNPDKRPTLEAILTHSWFFDGAFPSHIPITANDFPPDYRYLNVSASRRNFQALCQRARVGAMPTINTETGRMRTALGPSILQQERDFKNAVQPDSPISALLNSARQPLVQAPGQIKESSLLRKLTAAGAHATLSPARRGKENTAGPSGRKMEMVGEEEEDTDQAEDGAQLRGYDAAVREKELANQKARIVSQMATRGAPQQPVHTRVSPRKPQRMPGLSPAKTVVSDQRRYEPAPSTGLDVKNGRSKMSLFDVVGENLDAALTAGENFRSPSIEPDPDAPRVFVVSWLDYCTKYGMGFAMTDGTVSVHYNDTSSLVMSPDKQYFDHIAASASESDDLIMGIRSNYQIDRYPNDLNNKVYLLKKFEGYMLDRLMGSQPYHYVDRGLTKGMVFITRYLRMKHVILFRLSNDVLQFNFYDHTKLILSRDGLVVSMIDKYYVLRTWSLEALMQPMEEDDGVSVKDKRRVDGVLHKLGYARDVLLKIRSHAGHKTKQASTTASVPPPVQREAVREARPIR